MTGRGLGSTKQCVEMVIAGYRLIGPFRVVNGLNEWERK